MKRLQTQTEARFVFAFFLLFQNVHVQQLSSRKNLSSATTESNSRGSSHSIKPQLWCFGPVDGPVVCLAVRRQRPALAASERPSHNQTIFLIASL